MDPVAIAALRQADTALPLATVAVVGLGYVGLPLAVEFGRKRNTIGFDLSQTKVEHYRRFVDPTGEIASADLRAADRLSVTTDPAALAQADFICRQTSRVTAGRPEQH